LSPLVPVGAAGEDSATVSTELAARRTGMSFQRTRLSADRTLMSVIRTSLSLISFGFTIFQFFEKLKGSKIIADMSRAPRNFGSALVWLGVGLLIVGIVYHVQFMLGLRALRSEMRAQGLVHAQSGFPVSFTLLVALALLFIGFGAIASMTFHIGPFG
jgi:putative membrane protein